MNTNIVTAIYFDLHGTELGGRQRRDNQYLHGCLSLAKMDTKIYLYTNNKDRVLSYYNKNNIVTNNLTIIEYDITNTEYSNLINKYPKPEEVKLSQRCIPLQYEKFKWVTNHLDKEYVYWFDAGLTYTGIIPDKYLNTKSNVLNDRYYDTNLLTGNFLNNLQKVSGDKILFIAKDNLAYQSDYVLPKDNYADPKLYNNKYHIIGGLFGGKSSAASSLYNDFKDATKIIERNKRVYYEEVLMTYLYNNNPSKYTLQTFDIWWHENNIKPFFENYQEALNKYKSFYKILEEIGKLDD